MNNLLIILFAVIFMTACEKKQKNLEQEEEIGIVVNEMPCDEVSDFFGALGEPICLIGRLDSVRGLYEDSMLIFGRNFMVRHVTNEETPHGKYLLSPLEAPIDHLLLISVNEMQQSSMGEITKYLTIEKVCR